MEKKVVTKEMTESIAKIIAKMIPASVLTQIEVVDEGALHETVRVSGKLLAKEALDSSFTVILPAVQFLAELAK